MSSRAVRMMALVFALSFSAPAGAQDTEVVRVEVDLVTVNVSVTDGDKHPINDLRAADFRVTDQGRPVTLDFFDHEGPSGIVFVVDVSDSMRNEKWKRLTDGLKRFLARAREGNDYTLIAFGDEPRLVAESVSAEEVWQSFNVLEPSGQTALYDAVLVGLEALGRGSRRHKALVLLSDGEDTRSRARLAEVEREALARRATVYTVGIMGCDHQICQTKQSAGRKILTGLAEGTGGLAYFPAPDKIGEVLGKIITDLSGQYTLGYYAEDKEPGWRDIEVSIASAPRRHRLRYQRRYLKR